MKRRIFLLSIILFTSALIKLDAQNINANPQECVVNHLKYTGYENYMPQKAAYSFYHKNNSKQIELANKLKLIFDGKGLFVNTDEIPLNPAYKDSLTGLNRYYILDKRLPEIFVEKIGGRWYYSPDCYHDIEKLYREVYPFGSDLLIDNIPRFNNLKFLGAYIWQYLSLLIIIIISVLSYFLLKIIFRPLIAFIAEKSFNLHIELPIKYSKASKVAAMLLIFYFLKFAIALVRFPIKFSQFLVTSIDIIIVVFIGILIYRLFDIIMSFVKKLTDATPSKLDDQYLPILQQIAKLLIGIGIIFKVLILLNVNVTAIIAGLSIGGLALALASQDTVKNFIGSVMIFMDKPFKVDDWIEIDKFSGTVREVGFRSTRIEQLDTSIISIPNNIISNEALVNKGERNLRMYESNLAITFGTSTKKIEAFMEGLRRIATDHPKIFAKFNINLTGLGTSAINILFRIFFVTKNYEEELKLREEITFLIMELSEFLEIKFALPSQTLYYSKPPKPEQEDPNVSSAQVYKVKLDEFFKNRNFDYHIEDKDES